MMYAKRVKVGEVERYIFGLSEWLDGEAISNAAVTACGAQLSVSATDVAGDDIGFFVTGLVAGSGSVIVSYTTATRSDSVKLRINVAPATIC